METEEIIKGLRQCADRGGCEKCPYEDTDKGICIDNLMYEAADALESLQARLVEYDALAAEYGIDGKTMLTLAKSQIRTAQDNIKLREQLAASQRREKAAVKILQTIDWVGSGAKGRIEDAIGLLYGPREDEKGERQ